MFSHWSVQGMSVVSQEICDRTLLSFHRYLRKTDVGTLYDVPIAFESLSIGFDSM